MLNVEEAREKIAQVGAGLSWFEIVDLPQAYKRILAVECVSRVNVPPTNNSAMDGYAIKLPLDDSELTVSQTVSAGDDPEPLKNDTAARILTGATIPAGADAVVIQENCSRFGDQVRINTLVKPGDNIRAAGQDIKEGDIVLPKGSLISAASLGVLASCGIDKVTVIERPKVGVVTTGSELVEPGSPLKRGQIYSSNPYFLAALLSEWGCEVVSISKLPDDFAQTQEALLLLADEVDFIITSGGVSVGDLDFIKPAIERLGTLDFWKISMKPGKPLAFGTINTDKKRVPILGLPGNPVSTFVTAVLFAKPFVESLLGREYSALKPQYAPANFSTKKLRNRPEYIRVRMTRAGLMPFKNQSSGVLTSVQLSDALAIIPQDKTIQRGDMIAYYPMHTLTHLI